MTKIDVRKARRNNNMIAQITAPGDPGAGIMSCYATVIFEEGEIIFEDVPEAKERFVEGLRELFAELYDDGGVTVRLVTPSGEGEADDD